MVKLHCSEISSLEPPRSAFLLDLGLIPGGGKSYQCPGLLT